MVLTYKDGTGRNVRKVGGLFLYCTTRKSELMSFNNATLLHYAAKLKNI